MRAGLLLVLSCAACSPGPAERFAGEALPVLESRCSTPVCHGVAASEPWPEVPGLFFRLDARGRVADVEQARQMALTRVSTRAPLASSLVRVAMPRSADGGPHAGGAVLLGEDDDAAQALVRWIESEPSGGEDLDPTALEARFATSVLPVLTSRCGLPGCHGPGDVAFSPLAPRTGPDGSVTDVEVRRAHLRARRMLDLWGSDPRSSRLLRKAIGGQAGGLAHRGGSLTLFPEAPADAPFDTPELIAILQWAIVERDAIGAGAAPLGVVFVAGPPSTRSPWRIEPGPSGSELYLAGWPEPGAPIVLSAALHPDGPVEIRAPAISHDATRVTFAMRRERERDFALYEMQLADRSSRRLTAEGAGSFAQPVYAPDGRVLASWDGHGELGADGAGPAPELVAIDLASGSMERLTFTPAPEVGPTVLSAGRPRGEILFATRREGPIGPEAVLFRFPLCHDPSAHDEPEYHVHFGASLAPLAPVSARDRPDGTQAMIVLASASATDDRGALLLLDRSLGPDIGASGEAVSVAGYRRPIAIVDAEPRYRDVMALPDGRLLVSAGGALELLGVEGDLSSARLGERSTWLAMSGLELRSPALVARRPLEDDGHQPVTDGSLDRGRIALRDVAVLEMLFGRARPRGERVERGDIAALRLISSERSATAIRMDDGSTSAGLSARIPARVLGELALPSDGSAWLDVPTGAPLLLQLLDARGMQVGSSLDRWYFASGGEVVPGGTNRATYEHACAGCHGTISGDPADAALREPDVLSSASVTLASHRDRDRRSPLPPVTMMLDERVDYVTSVLPIVRAECVSCHSSGASLDLEARAGLRFDAGYEALAAFVDLGTLRARRSALIERVTGLELDAEAPLRGRCPPEGASDATVSALVRWIEAGAFYDLASGP